MTSEALMAQMDLLRRSLLAVFFAPDKMVVKKAESAPDCASTIATKWPHPRQQSTSLAATDIDCQR